MAENKKTPHVDDDPLFRTYIGALMFALNYAHGGQKKPFLAQMVGGGKTGRGLGGLDGAGQAGMIKAELERLDEVRRAIMIARYEAPSLPCACGALCCRKHRENPTWAEAIRTLVQAVLEEGAAGTVSHYRLRDAMVRRYFGVKASFTEIAALCKISRNTASAQNAKVADWLKKEERFAKFEIEGILKNAGVVE